MFSNALNVPCVPVLAELILRAVGAVAPCVLWYGNLPAAVPPLLRRRQFLDQRPGADPRSGADWDGDAVGGLLVEILGRPAEAVSGMEQKRLVIHAAQLPQPTHLRRGKIAVPHHQVDVVAVIPVAALDEVDVVEGNSLLPFFQSGSALPGNP